jgi:DNA-binding NarL/FixJ family response regulator
MQIINILLVDDHPVVRQGLNSLLSQYPDIHVIAEADRGSVVLEQAAKFRPDVILLDVRLEDASGLDIARQLRRAQCTSRIIILTSYDDENYLLEAARLGVDGFLLKNSSAESLADAIRAVHAGEQRLSAGLGGKAFEQLKALSQTQVRAQSGLSEQELQLLQYIANGASVEEITRALYLSERTIKRKTKDVLSKLGATSRAQAVAEGFKRGLL